MSHFLYILRCADNTYYVGRTTDLERRLREHNFLKRGARYTKMRRPVTIQYTEEHETLSDVLKREYRIKQMTRQEKELLLKKGIRRVKGDKGDKRL